MCTQKTCSSQKSVWIYSTGTGTGVGLGFQKRLPNLLLSALIAAVPASTQQIDVLKYRYLQECLQNSSVPGKHSVNIL